MSNAKNYLRKITGEATDHQPLPSVADVPSVSDQGMMRFLRSVRDWIKTATGNTPDALMSQRDLLRAGVLVKNSDGSVISVTGSPDYAPPAAPTGLAASGAMSNVLLTWNSTTNTNVAYAEIYCATTNSLAAATLVGATAGSQFAHAVGAGQTRYYWIRYVSKFAVRGPWNASSGTQGVTSDDPSWLLSVLNGQLSESQLATALRGRVNYIDGSDFGATSLPTDMLNGLTAAMRKLRAEHSDTVRNVDSAYEKVVQMLVHLKKVDDTFRTAGIDVNPATGMITIYALDQLRSDTSTSLSNVQIQMDAVNSSLALTATKTYVDGAIAQAVIAPDQIPAFQGLYARMDTAEINISANTAAIALKASTTTVNGIDSRLTTAEGSITTLSGSVATKAAQSDLTALTGRVTTAETNISAIDGASITSSAKDSRYLLRSEDATAEKTLAGMMDAQRKMNVLSQGLAEVRSDYTAAVSVVDGKLSAETAARLSLAAVVDSNAAAINSEMVARTDADRSLASSIETLSASTGSSIAAVQSSITALTTSTTATATQVSTLGTTVAGNTASIQTQQTSIDGLSVQYTMKLDNNGYVSGFGLSSTGPKDSPISDFTIIADRFTIAPVATDLASSDGSPFFYLTSPTTIGGVSVPAGAYMKAAYIHDAAITNAKIADLAVDSAKIANAAITNAKINDLDAGKINAGTLSASRIGANSITASHIDSRGLSIKDVSGNVILAAGTPLDYSNINPSSGWLNSNVTLGTLGYTGAIDANKTYIDGSGNIQGVSSGAGTLVSNGRISINSNGTLTGAGSGQVTLGGLGAGAFATLSQINASNISTYIAGAAIGGAYIGSAAIQNAHIGDLQVDTIKIAHGSITDTVYASTSSSVAGSGAGRVYFNTLNLPATMTTNDKYVVLGNMVFGIDTGYADGSHGTGYSYGIEVLVGGTWYTLQTLYGAFPMMTTGSPVYGYLQSGNIVVVMRGSGYFGYAGATQLRMFIDSPTYVYANYAASNTTLIAMRVMK